MRAGFRTPSQQSALNVARTQGAAFEVAKLVEHEQRMVVGAGIMAIPDAVLLFAVRRTHARIQVEHDTSWRTTTWTASIHWPERSASAEWFFSTVSQRVSKRPIWLGDAAALNAALPPTIQRIAGS